jgi:hypothetical protein
MNGPHSAILRFYAAHYSSRAKVRLIARLHHPGSVRPLPLSRFDRRCIAVTAALDLEERHRCHMLLRAWMEDKPQARCNEAQRAGRQSQWVSAGLYKKPVPRPFLKSQ